MLKILKSLFLLAFLMALSSYAFFSYNVNKPMDANGKDTAFVIAKGDGVKKIGAELKKAGLIRSQFFFETYVWTEGKQSSFQAGEYVLSPKLSMRDIVRVFVKGETISKEREIKIIEGWTTKDIAEYLETEKIGKKEDFYALAGYPASGYRLLSSKMPDYAKDFAFLKDKPKADGLEGYLFPDTYRIFKDAKQEDIVKKMLANFDKKLTKEMRAEIAKQGKTIYQIVTMASVVEKEVRKEEDMKIVAGIFWNRIKSGQALESCASLAYILGVNKPIYTIEDTKTDSPYNTYKHRGLPPGPISNPGILAISAAIYPTNTQYNYFLSRPDTGETVFAKTYQDHLNNKDKYLK